MTDKSDTNWYGEDAATFGDRLSGAREHAGLSVTALAEQIGVRLDTVRAWEDDVKEPRANRLQMLSGLLGVSLTWLLTGRGDGPTEPSEAAEIDRDLAGLLAEMRALRAQMMLSADKLAQLEKRFRKALKEA